MIQLWTLGQVNLRRSPEDVVSVVLAQPKRLALLVYLAIARPRGPHRKDILRAMFWPDAGDRRARLALNRALYFLRHALGDEVLRSGPGDALVVARDVLWCDAVAFEELLDAGRVDEACELHRGNLLEGFFASGAPEFEHWLDDKRRRLEQRAAAATLSLSEREEARGDLAGAVRWARDASELSPYAENALRRLLGLLDRAGERAEAVQRYGEFAKRLAIDLDVAPSPETRSLIEVIRARADPWSNASRIRVSAPRKPIGRPRRSPLARERGG